MYVLNRKSQSNSRNVQNRMFDIYSKYGSLSKEEIQADWINRHKKRDIKSFMAGRIGYEYIQVKWHLRNLRRAS